MRKKWIAIFTALAVLFSSQTAFAFEQEVIYGWDIIYRSDNLVYINNTPIQSYIIENQAFVVIDDLQRYGFSVVSDEKEKKITISKIPGKEPDPLTEEEYRKLTTRGTVRTRLLDAKVTYDTAVFLEDKVLLVTSDPEMDIFHMDGTFLIRLSILAKFYGTSQWDPVSRTTYVTIENDHPAIQTDFSEEKIRVTKSLGYQAPIGGNGPDINLHLADQYLKVQQKKIHLGGIKVSLRASEQGSIYDEYIYLGHDLMEDLGITYQLIGNTLFLQCPKLPADSKIEAGFVSVMQMGTLSCVDLKLIANGQEIREDSPLPIFLSINGRLYMNLRIFFNIVDL